MQLIFINSKKSPNLSIQTITDFIITISIHNLSPNQLKNLLLQIPNQSPKKISIQFKQIPSNLSKFILLQLSNIFFDFLHPPSFSIPNEFQKLLQETIDYQRIVIQPNKNQKTMLKYLISKIPKNYTYKKFNIKRNDQTFPLSAAVNQGSSNPSYFLHIFPKKINKKYPNIFLIGKCVTFDTGGLDLKNYMTNMKIDMAASALTIAALQLSNQLQKNLNLLIPITENNIDGNSIKPSSVVKTLNGKTVEITNTDAEGRLCIVDAIEYYNKFLSKKGDFLMDIGTLTGTVRQISCGVSSVVTCNEKGEKYMRELVDVGEEVFEYVDYIRLREEYENDLKSDVADIKNSGEDCQAMTMVCAAFINYFVKSDVAWVHLDIAGMVYRDEKVSGYGVELLRSFLEKV